jgi:hypothetical protein
MSVDLEILIAPSYKVELQSPPPRTPPDCLTIDLYQKTKYGGFQLQQKLLGLVSLLGKK